ncbi:hypothetical protein EKN38_22410 [Enterobacter sp. WCHEn045836]|uniref:hypothetical protein n=1 Tax=Enterobacter sp. WCHEn045836 TaxID=2497434 RepID=UPI000F833496|nr:hypothetical protein [Enterobacter sp. WCHEn045836]RTP97293.1 hypothetical protein EKN38_22410 [Enterobacter sp. WCHEn045836]
MSKRITLLALSALLSGCQTPLVHTEQSPSSGHVEAIVQPASGFASVVDLSEITSCTNELSALQQVSPSIYQIRNAELHSIRIQEQIYLKVRKSINENSISVMDAAYKYKISKICSDIRNDLTNELVNKVEKAYQYNTPAPFSVDN